MTREILEKLRTENKQFAIDILNKTAEWYKYFAERIRKDEFLTDADWGNMNDETLINVEYVDENGEKNLISFTYIFSKEIETELNN